MKSLIKIHVLVSLFVLFFVLSCSDNENVYPEAEILVEKNYYPVEGCPDGTIWDNHLGECVPEQVPTPPTPTDINPSSLTFYTSINEWENFGTIEHKEVTLLHIKGSVLNDMQYWKTKMFLDGVFSGEELIIGQIEIGAFTYTDYHDINGKFIGRVKLEDENIFRDWEAGWIGPVDGSDFIAHGFVGNIAKCYGQVFSDFTSGTVLGTAAGIACGFFWAKCMAFVGVGCTIMAIAVT